LEGGEELREEKVAVGCRSAVGPGVDLGRKYPTVLDGVEALPELVVREACSSFLPVS